MTSSWQGVMTVHRPWQNQAKKNLNSFFFIISKRLSNPLFSILPNKNAPSLKAQIAMREAAMICLLLRLLKYKTKPNVERQVMLPVRSQNISVLKMAAGMKATICTKKQQVFSSQIRGTSKTTFDSPPIAKESSATTRAMMGQGSSCSIILSMVLTKLLSVNIKVVIAF